MNLSKLTHPSFIGDLTALLAGIMLTFAFAPFNIALLAVISPAILLTTWLQVGKKRAFRRGFLFGSGLFASGVYWVFISIHEFGNTSTLLALIVTAGFVAILALFPAINGYWLNRFFPKNNFAKLVLAFPALWVLLEWIRSWVFSGFPWLSLGYSQLHSPLKGFAPISSVYSISLLLAISAGLIVNAAQLWKRKKYSLLYFHLLAFIFIWACGGILSYIHWTTPKGEPVKISLIQGNIPQLLKWSPEQVVPTLNRYQTLTEAHWDSKIIIWPESAIPLVLQNSGNFLDQLADKATQHQVTIIAGIPVESPESGKYYNAIITLGNGTGIYAKHRLVPFGEFVPMSKMLTRLFDFMQIPMSDFVPGPRNLKPLEVDNIKIAAFICYEIAFPEQVRSRDDDIGMILTVSNDAWFGHSIAQAQHLEMGQMRALEMGRPVLFVSNNGMTAFITPYGKIQSVAPPFETVVLTDSMQAYTGKTPWQIIGMDPLLILIVIMLIVSRCTPFEKGDRRH